MIDTNPEHMLKIQEHFIFDSLLNDGSLEAAYGLIVKKYPHASSWIRMLTETTLSKYDIKGELRNKMMMSFIDNCLTVLAGLDDINKSEN